ncbi:arylsulfatase H [Procambarus clarkii]|uniref:arylsulfatase H n=1 Tax=Procambarus clarkii TaxID=6728 RepID=UPI001E670690|nr:arylsulfatase H-like [Procambarus clarkii]
MVEVNVRWWAVVVVVGVIASGGCGRLLQYHQQQAQKEHQAEPVKEQQQQEKQEQQTRRQSLPNIVVLVADDLGIGDLGCYGNTTINTPNIDRLARDGVRLTHHLAAAPLCTPSRAALLTARYPARYGLVGEDGTPPEIMHVASRVGLPVEEVTLAKALSMVNYTTAAIGKWHLGQMCGAFGRGCLGPKRHGFQYFYGLPFTLAPEAAGSHPFWIFPLDDPFYQSITAGCLASTVVIAVGWWWYKWRRLVLGLFVVVVVLAGAISWFLRTHYRLYTQWWWQVSPWMIQHLNCIVMQDGVVVEQPLVLEGLSQRLVSHSLRFIANHTTHGRPFFLYHAFAHVHTPMFTLPSMAGRSRHGRYGDNVEEMDAGVGKILDALTRHNLDNNTIVYFVSDHGAHLEAIAPDGQRTGGYNGRFKGGKSMGGAEGGIRVPGIYRWSGHLPAGVTVDHPTSLLDMMPTLLHLAGLPPLHQLLPNLPYRGLDGVSLAGLLKNGSSPPARVLLHHCQQAIHALRLVQDKKVYKMHIAGHKWPEGSTQCGWGEGTYCQCYGDTIQHYGHQPLLFDLQKDPYEDHPIPTNTTEYIDVTGMLQRYLTNWRSRVPYPRSQFRSVVNTILSPWLQPFRWP